MVLVAFREGWHLFKKLCAAFKESYTFSVSQKRDRCSTFSRVAKVAAGPSPAPFDVDNTKGSTGKKMFPVRESNPARACERRES